jgi:hypothetical protein
MSNRTPNLALLRKIFDHWRAHPEQFDQDTWASRDPDGNVTHCAGGWAVELSPECHIVWYSPVKGTSAAEWAYDRDGNHVLIRDLAEELLGLTHNEALQLFFGTDDFDEAYEVGQRIAARAGERL